MIRVPAGVPTGGQFKPGRHDETDTALEPAAAATEAMPLQHFRIVGFSRKTFSPAAGITLPGGTCGHCGAALINCVSVRHDLRLD